jgi:hypothetical protein
MAARNSTLGRFPENRMGYSGIKVIWRKLEILNDFNTCVQFFADFERFEQHDFTPLKDGHC